MEELDPLVNKLVDLESDFGLPDGFLIALWKESDWSFTIKVHSLIEAALTQALVAEVAEPRLDKLLEGLSVLGRHSKVAYAEAVGLLPKTSSDFIRRLTKIRNHVVHKLEAVSFTFASYVDELDDSERQNTLNELLFLGGGPKGKANDLFAKKPCIAVWVQAIAVVTDLVARKARAEHKVQLRSHYKNVAEQVLGPLKDL